MKCWNHTIGDVSDSQTIWTRSSAMMHALCILMVRVLGLDQEYVLMWTEYEYDRVCASFLPPGCAAVLLSTRLL